MNGLGVGWSETHRIHDRLVLAGMYKRISLPEELPWQRDEPPAFLRDFVDSQQRYGRALDIGCGTGETAVYLASKGYEVTAVDYLESPLQFARALADHAGVHVAFCQQDILRWRGDGLYDLIIDQGCLHHINERATQQYRSVILRALSETGDLLVAHLSSPIRRSHGFSIAVPRLRTPVDIRRLFAPSLRLQEYAVEHISGSNLDRARAIMFAHYRFRRLSNSHL